MLERASVSVDARGGGMNRSTKCVYDLPLTCIPRFYSKRIDVDELDEDITSQRLAIINLIRVKLERW